MRTGWLAGLLEPGPVDQADLDRRVLEPRVPAQQLGGPSRRGSTRHGVHRRRALGPGIVESSHGGQPTSGPASAPAGLRGSEPGVGATVIPHAPRLDHRPRRPAGPVLRRARRAGRRDPPVHRRRRLRAPAAATWARTSAPSSSPSPCTGCSTPPATSSCGTPATRPTSTRSSPAGGPPVHRPCARRAACRATRPGTSPSTTGSRTATPPRSSATPTAWPSPRSTRAARAAGSSP